MYTCTCPYLSVISIAGGNVFASFILVMTTISPLLMEYLVQVVSCIHLHASMHIHVHAHIMKFNGVKRG